MSLAKLTPPSAAGLMPRERLFARLDAASAHGLVWIAAPAGAGKTSLATSWLAARGIRALWYRVDADDSDPANFFHYLARAREASEAGLPALTPECLPGLETFSRRFFRALFEALPPPFVLAFDNFQEVSAQAPLHMLLAVAAEELPPGAMLLVMSRREPTLALTRTFATGATLGWEDLRFTESETRDLLDALGIEDAEKKLAAAGGWAVGIVLGARATDTRSEYIDAEQAPQAVYDFIAAEFFDALPSERREFLLRVGALPVVTEAYCVALTGNNRGLGWLAELHQEHLLVTRQAQADLAYEFHPLFHAFLKHRIEFVLDAHERADIFRNSAKLLEQSGMVKSAAEAWARSADLPEFARFICTHAPDWITSGRHATVLAWIDQLPDSLREASPWLRFWTAACRMMTDPAVARGDFERAYAAFGRTGDLAGQWLCWSGIAETFLYGWDSLAGFDPWIAQLESLLARQREFPSPEVEARVLSGAVALAFRRPDHPLLPIWADRALTLVRSRQVLVQTAMLAHFAGVYHMWRGNTRGMDTVLEAVRIVDAPMTPLGRLLMSMLDLVSANFQGDTPRVERAFADAMAFAREHGVHLLDVPLMQNAGLAALARGDADRMEDLIRLAQPKLLPGRWLEASAQVYVEAGHAMLRGELTEARARVNKAVSFADMGGVPHWETHYRLLVVHLEILDGKGGACIGELESIIAEARRTGCDLYLAAALLALALTRLDTGDTAVATETLREGLAIGSRWAYGHLFLYSTPYAESRLCVLALEAGIEPCYVRRLISQRELLPPENAGESWPWPLRIITLGSFRLVRDGEEVHQQGKPQKKPLELLQTLIAQGSSGTAALKLAALLWPDADGATLKKILDITLHRLRKLLGRDDAVLLREGRLVLNSRLCWVDLWAFEQEADAVLAALHTSAAGNEKIMHAAARALHLFGGAFLASEEEASWQLPARDRATSRLQRLLADLGRHHEQAGRWELAAELYQKALEQDNLNEFLYRQLIFCLQQQGRHAEALSVFRRCRQLLSIVLGVAPAPETESLIRHSRDA